VSPAAGALAGHFWTVAPRLASWLAAPAVPPDRRVTLPFVDPLRGELALTGRLAEPTGARTLVLVLHGLAGSAESPYARRLAARLYADGVASLRLDFRGAGGVGPDFYHAGLTEDLRTALGAPEIARYERVAIVGFSLGGHLALRWAGEEGAGADARVLGLVAVSSPLDLELGARALDARGNALYRSYLLRGLRRHAERIERERPGTVAGSRTERARARTIRAWDALVVAPRWGFASAEDYYERASAAPVLPAVRIPAWVVHAEHDPMVPLWTVREALGRLPPGVEVTLTRRGGHVGMPGDLDLGRAGDRGLEAQILDWLRVRS
jgi:predicted alpha/beta-fold hydrolase